DGIRDLIVTGVQTCALPIFGRTRLAVSAVLMGGGINAMHYTGMAALRMSPGIVYDPWLFALSVAIAIGASALALWIAFRLRHNRSEERRVGKELRTRSSTRT